MKIVAIIQARMTSTRLPKKVLLSLPEGSNVTVLEQVVKRVRQIRQVDEIIVATTVLPTDDPIVGLAHKVGFKVYRGSEEDVLGRYYEAAKQANADHVVRITSDCPCVDINIISDVIQAHLETKSDYTSNTLNPKDPLGILRLKVTRLMDRRI